MVKLIALQLVILLIITSIKTTPAGIKEIAKKFGCDYNIESYGIFLLCDFRQSSKYEKTDIKPYFQNSVKSLMVRSHLMPPDELVLLLKTLNDSNEYVFTHLEVHETKVEKSLWDLVSTITNLQTLAMDNCKVSELPIASLNELINLKQLFLRYNNIRSLNGRLKLENLEIFNVDDNNIRHVSNDFFKNSPRLKSVYLSNNKIKYLNSNLCSKYTVKLYLNYNNIDNIDTSFVKTCESIEQLSLIKNSFEVIPSDSFPEFLKTLVFSNNTKTIKSFPRSAFRGDVPERTNLNGNIFNCSCDLQWIKENNVDNLHSLKCEDATGTKLFTRVELCQKSTTSTPSTPSTASQSTPSTASETTPSIPSTASQRTPSTESLSTPSPASQSTPSTVSNSTKPSFEKLEMEEEFSLKEYKFLILGAIIIIIIIILSSIYIVCKKKRKKSTGSMDINDVRRSSSDVGQDVAIPMTETNLSTSTEDPTEGSDNRTYIINMYNIFWNCGKKSGRLTVNAGSGN